jgi:ankyrin repeat protein
MSDQESDNGSVGDDFETMDHIIELIDENQLEELKPFIYFECEHSSTEFTFTPLLYALTYKKYNVASSLISNGHPTDYQIGVEKDGTGTIYTLLGYIVSRGDCKGVDLLLKSGCTDINTPMEDAESGYHDGYTPYEIAYEQEDTEMKQLLIENNASTTLHRESYEFGRKDE